MPIRFVAAMAAAGPEGERAIGCTQVTEILYTPGVTLIGLLPLGRMTSRRLLDPTP